MKYYQNRLVPRGMDLHKKLPASENADEVHSIPSTTKKRSKDGDDNMSGLSIDLDSSDDDNEPIMNTIKCKR